MNVNVIVRAGMCVSMLCQGGIHLILVSYLSSQFRWNIFSPVTLPPQWRVLMTRNGCTAV